MWIISTNPSLFIILYNNCTILVAHLKKDVKGRKEPRIDEKRQSKL